MYFAPLRVFLPVAPVFGLSCPSSLGIGVCVRRDLTEATLVLIVAQLAGPGASSPFSRGLELGAYVVVYRFTGIPCVAAAVVVLGISTVVKYVVYNFWLFSREKT